ncbi:serine hydrolase domain-containing protein [Kribbella capetownensis]|nr:serine hydrolase domain-containing protein [Kribbella capetownensis]
MDLRGSVEAGFWPLVESFAGSHDVAGLAVAVVRDEEVVARGFGVRDVGTGAPVTPETMFHLASVSKPFVATAIMSLATAREAGEPALDLDAPITEWVPEFTLADGRAGDVTARRLLSHTSGLPDVTDYGWHDPQLGDDALSEFARSLSDWRLQAEPGSAFAYSNAGFELLGLLLSRVTGTTFENAVRREVLAPLGMRDSTFLRSEVPAHLAASPHVGMPLSVPEGSYPYTRRHAPSSSLHSNLVELCRWMVAHFEPASDGRWARLDPELLDLMCRPVVSVGNPPWQEAAGLGWALGNYRGHRTLSHSGLDPGFGSRLVLVPERRTGVVVLANSNTIPASPIAKAALDIALADHHVSSATPESVVAIRALLPSIAGPVAEALKTSGRDAAEAAYHRLVAVEPAEFDLDDEGFDDGVWGAIELHRTDLVWPLLRVWTELRPDSSAAWTMTGWAHQLDGQLDLARSALRRAVDLDPGNDDAAQLMSGLPSA